MTLLNTRALLARVIAGGRKLCAANIAEGTHEEGITKLVDAAITTRFLLVKKGSDNNHVAAMTAASDEPWGVCEDEAAAAEDPVHVQLLGVSKRTVKMVASEALATVNTRLYATADGKVQDEPAGAGTYWLVGRNVTAASTDGDEVEVEPCMPVKFIVS